MVQRILRLARVLEVTGKGRSQLYADIAIGAFPKPILLGKRAVGWLEAEVEAWQQARVAERNRVSTAAKSPAVAS